MSSIWDIHPRSCTLNVHHPNRLSTNLGDLQVFNQIETAWLIPILTAIGKLSRTT